MQFFVYYACVSIYIYIYIYILSREAMHTRFWWGNLRGIDHLEDLGIDGSIILRWILRKWDGGLGLD
jgi:hypothetical protein